MAEELMTRAFGTDLEVRATAKGRTVVGIAVPWDAEQEIDAFLVEGFRSGAFDHQLAAFERVKLAREHITLGGRLIGRGLLARNDAAGLYVEMLAAHTDVAEETLQLLQAGALSALSAGFLPRQNRAARSARYPGRDTVWRVTADLREVAVVLEGAYGDLAVATAVRSPQQRPGLDAARSVLDSLPPLPAPPPA